MPIEKSKKEEKQILMTEKISTSLPAGEMEWIEPNKSVRISLLEKSGKLPSKSGLNWGQRPRREQNQAYLSIRKDARKYLMH